MTLTTGAIIGLVAGLLIGFVVAQLIMRNSIKKKIAEMNTRTDLQIKEARLSAKRIVDEAETEAEKINSKAEAKNERIKQRKIQEAKAKYSKMRSEFDKEKAAHRIELKEMGIQVKEQEADLKQRLEKFEERVKWFEAEQEEVKQKASELDSIRENLDTQLKVVARKREQLDSANEERIKELQKIANLTEAEAKERLLEAVRAKAETDALAIEKAAVERAQQSATKQAKNIIIKSIQRMCAETTIENTVSVFNLDSDDLKGQIIGREGRNIRALEAATGAEIVVDDTPEAIVISSFDPIRRETCRLALKKLVADGRIHPHVSKKWLPKPKSSSTSKLSKLVSVPLSISTCMVWILTWLKWWAGCATALPTDRIC